MTATQIDDGGADEPPPVATSVWGRVFDLVAGSGPHFRFAQTAEAVGLFTYLRRRDCDAFDRCLVGGSVSG